MSTLPDSYLADVEREILAGLPNEQERRAECLRNMDYYHLRGAKLIPRRDAETDQDYRIRPKRHLPFTSRVVKVLASKLYAPGPNRVVVGQDAATKWLEQVCVQNLMNSLWQRADRMSTLNGMAAFQVSATGDPKRPLRVQLWAGWHEVIPLEHPDQANEVASVITVDCVDNRTRYTWWTDEFYRVYQTDKLRPGQTSGGRAAHFEPRLSGDNTYGIIPFSFVWYELPLNGIDSVEGLGGFLTSLNTTLDCECSDMAQAVQNYHDPLPVAFNADVGFAPIKASGKWVRVNSVPTDLERGPDPRLEYIQARIDTVGGIAHLRGVIDLELEGLGIPLTAWRMESATLPSGAALEAEQKPLVDYAIERREPFRVYETGFAKVALTVGGTFYGQQELVTAAADLDLNLTWPPASISLPGIDRDTDDQNSLAMGLESRVMIVMRRFGMSRDQAIEHLKQAIADEAELAGLGLTPPPKGAAAAPPAGPDPAEDDELPTGQSAQSEGEQAARENY
jgi:hypothetical protein